MAENMETEQIDPVRAEIALLMDGAMLQQRFAGDEELMNEVLSVLIEAISGDRRALGPGELDNGDHAAVAQRVHNLASSLSPIGLSGLSRRCMEVESAILHGDTGRAREGLGEIEFYLGELETTLRRLAPRHDAP